MITRTPSAEAILSIERIDSVVRRPIGVGLFFNRKHGANVLEEHGLFNGRSPSGLMNTPELPTGDYPVPRR